jgi:hypothetical protein
VGTRLHTFVIAFTVRDLDPTIAAELTAAAQQYAIRNKGGLPRGLQTGSATVAAFLTDCDAAHVRSWFELKPQHRFAALRFPVLLEVGSGRVTYFRDRLRAGAVYSGHLQALVGDIIAPVVMTSGD